MDLTLQKEALAIQGVLSPYVFEYYNEPILLQDRVSFLTEQNPDLSRIRVFLPAEDEKFKIIASHSREEVDDRHEETALTLSWHKTQAIAFLVEEGGVRYWRAVSPFYNLENEKVGLTSIDLSLESIDAAVTEELERAYFFALIAMILILFLVIHHTHLFQYVNLFHRLRELEKSKDSFMNMAVHELRSPMVNIKNYLIEFKREVENKLNKAELEDISRAEISAKRLDTLIEDILNVVRIEQGQLSFDPQEVSLVTLIGEVVQELRGKAEDSGLTLEFDLNANKEVIASINPNRFKEVIYNLLDNAIKYTFKGKVRIKTEKDLPRRKFYIIIDDTGIGISAEDQQKIFERFYRVKSRETSDIIGTGLGLWIVKHLCKRLKIPILLESIKGVGSKFIIVFPLREQ